jgi:hypothetical protein
MIRKLLSVVAASALVLGAGTALAGDFDPANSVLSVQVGSLPSIGVVANGGGSATLSNSAGGHTVADDAAVWDTTDFGPGTAMFTGIPLIENLKITVVNKSGSMANGWGPVPNPLDGGSTCKPGDINATCLGGYEPLQGQAVIHALGGLQVPISLNPVGWIAGGTATAKVLNNNLTLTAMSFVTGTVKITGISTNLVTIPNRGGQSGAIYTLNLTPVEHGTAVNVTVAGVIQELQTVTVNGTNGLLSADSTEDTMVTLISPIRVNTGGLVGRIPALVKKKFTFVPEPGTMLLLVSGAVGLAVVGRKRMRK